MKRTQAAGMSDYPGAVWTPGKNYDRGRKGAHPRYIVIHGTASPNQDIDWWAARAHDRGGVHYMVGRQFYAIAAHLPNTQVIQFVRETDTAWGNGVQDSGHVPFFGGDPNLETLSVEHVKFDPYNSGDLTDSQMQESCKLIAYLCNKWKIPPRLGDNAGGILSHYQIAPGHRWFCPGPYRWDVLFSYLADNVK